MTDVVQTIQSCVDVAGSSAADWAQFWATVIGLGVAIAVPAWLHLREAKERKIERDARARTHAIQLLGSLENLADSLDKLRRDPGADVRPLSEALVEIGGGKRAPDSLPKKINYLDETLVASLFDRVVFHEMGDAAEDLQVFYSDWQQLTRHADFLRIMDAALIEAHGHTSPDELLKRLDHATNLLSKAVTSMNRLFPGSFDAKASATK